MCVTLLKTQVEKSRASVQEKKNDKDDSTASSSSGTCTDTVFPDSRGWLHKGSLKTDATYAYVGVRYPTDIDLLHDGCTVINRYIGKFASYSLLFLL